MNKSTKLLIIFVSAIALPSGIFFQQFLNANDQLPKQTLNDAKLLNFTLTDLEAKPHNISEWQSKIRIINFWATWCPPCLKEIPEFIKLQNELSDKNVQFIGIAIDEKQNIANYIKSNPINYPILIAGNSGVNLSLQLGNVYKAVPFTLIVNQHNKIIYRQPGEISRQTILEIISPILQNGQ